jgi:hypothetical protein
MFFPLPCSAFARLLIIGLSFVLLYGFALSAQESRTGAKGYKDPLLPQTPAVVVPTTPPEPAPKRSVLFRWRYNMPTSANLIAAIWVSIDGGEWREIARTMPGETSYHYETTVLSVMHCYYIVPIEDGLARPKSKTECVFLAPFAQALDFSVSVK